jgi:hypothetical protein
MLLRNRDRNSKGNDNNRHDGRISRTTSSRLVYVGAQSFSAIVIPTKGSNEVLIVSFNAIRIIEAGDFIRICSQVYRVIQLDHDVMTISSKYVGEETGIPCEAHYNFGPNVLF